MDTRKRRRIIYVLLFLAIIGYMISSKKKKEAQQEKLRLETQQRSTILSKSYELWQRKHWSILKPIKM
ncbi:MAG: hypothetical protein AAF617_12430 [Bacteroidota bacterium]